MAADGAELFAAYWRCAKPKAAVLIVHGYAEHCLRYAPLARVLNDAGYTVSAYDHRHHGQSPGELGYIARFDALIDDLDEVVEQFRAQTANLPLFIFAHSMGGLVTANYLVRYKPANLRGAV
ncbi:MAG: alpha/beta fold hydrolase, partial [Candidatus Hydrogenedentales bacterium]